MTSDCFNLSEFSEYLDDTDGHRLAQFLQKKSGTVRNGAKRIFDAEPQRFSLNVRLKRLSSPPVPVTDVENECVIPETQETDNEKDVQNKEQEAVLLPEQEIFQLKVAQVKNDAQTLASSVNESLNNTQQKKETCHASVLVMIPMGNNITCPENKSMTISSVKSRTEQCILGSKVGSTSKIAEAVQASIIAEQNRMEQLPLPMCPESVSPKRLEEPNGAQETQQQQQAVSPRSLCTFLQPKISRPIIPQTPRSPISKVSRSGDRLRRQVLKRITNLENNGRRTLLSEFESTLCSTNFSPAICSTPMHHTPPVNLLKTPPRINNSLNEPKTSPRPKTPEINACIPSKEASQHTKHNAVQEQPLLQNLVEALEDTINKLKSFENPPHTRIITAESDINTTELPQTQEQLQQQALVQASTGNVVDKSKVLATEALLQEVQKTLADLKNSNLQMPKIVIPVNQTFNNAPTAAAAANKQIGEKETNHECEDAKVTQSETQADHKTAFTHSNCTRQHTITAANLNDASSCNSPNNFINHPTFTCNNTRNTNLPTNSVQHKNVTTPVGNRKVAADNNKTNLSGANSILLNADNKRSANRSAHTTLNNNKNLEANLVKTQTFVKHDVSKCTTLKNREEVGTVTANKEANTKRGLTEMSISMLITDDEDEEEDINYNVNKRQTLRKSGPLNLATEKPQKTKRNRRTIKRTMRTRLHHRSTKPFASPPTLLTSDTDTETGPPPAHPLNLQHVKPVEHIKIQQLRRRRPLNKAPSTPKNGELFADELKAHLARLTNHEILDLRKRNSMGLMNGKRLKKSSGSTKQALEEKLKIEEEIQLEILRRELLGNTQGLREEEQQQQQQTYADEMNPEQRSESESQLVNEVVEVVKEIIFDELPQAPAAFKDNTAVAAAAFMDNSTAAPALLTDNTAGAAAKAIENNVDAVVAALETEDNGVATVMPDVPEPFKDNVAAPDAFNINASAENIMQQTVAQLTQRMCYNSSLIDDRSSERVTFVSAKRNNVQNTKNARKSAQRNKKSELPEVTIKYFQIEESIKMRRKDSTSKRSLYNKGDSFDENSDASDSEKENFLKISTLTEPIPPPPVVSPVGDIQITSPPPPVTDWTTASTFMLPNLPADQLVLPPTPFSDKQINSSVNGAKPKTLSASHNNTAAIEAICQHDEELFKKPTKRAPRASRKRKTQESRTNKSSHVTQTERTDDSAGIRRSTRGQVPTNRNSKWNGHSLLETLFNKPTKSSSSNRSIKKQTNRTSSSCSIESRGGDLTTPVASSTGLNIANVKKRGRKPQKPQSPVFSYLGDTNVTSGTVYSLRNTESDALSTQLEAIQETPIETDGLDAAAASPASNDNELPTTSSCKTGKSNKNTTKANNKQTAGVKKLGRPRKTGTVSKIKQQQQQQQQEETDAVEAAQQVADDDTANRTGQLECSRVYLPPPPSLEKLSEMFDALKNAANNLSDEEGTPNGAESSVPTPTEGNVGIRPVRVRLRRLTARDTSTATAQSSASTSATNSESTRTTENDRQELLAWLKNVSHLQSATNERQVFMDLRPSTAGKLFFTNLEGIDYAFYDTEHKCTLGYLRFKPLQCKPSKRAKKYHLHFVVLAGSFEISTDRESANFGVGDMVAINIGCRYKITNLENDIGVLMVIKK
ncbi:serine-rich adhesin for platelets isoform X3 [Bactrocera oleae]